MIFFSILGLMIIPVLFPNGANAAWKAGYGYRKSITIDPTKVSGASNLSSFPVVFNVTDANLKTVANGGHVRSASGYDIIFTSSDGMTQLDHEIELYKATTGEFIAWIRIPTLDTTNNTVIYVYYGNASIVTSQEDIEGVWSSSSFSMVHHLNEAAAPFVDSTSYSNDGSIVGTPTGGPTTGTIDGGYNFALDDSYIKVLNSASVTPGTAYTMTAWIRPTSCGENGNGTVLDKYNAYALAIKSEGGTIGAPCGMYFRYGASVTPTASAAVTLNAWNFVGVSTNGSTLKLWVNNTAVGTYEGTFTVGSNSNDLWLGGRYSMLVQADYELGGVEDEVRIVGANRTDDWLITEYNNQSSPSTFYAVGSEELDATPTITSLTLNGGADITLNENSTKAVNWTATITDANGYSDINAVIGRIYRSGIAGAQACTLSNNNCYADASCDLINCVSNSCTATCSANVYFHADSTDADSSYSAEYWRAWMQVTDFGGHTVTGFSAAGSPELQSLVALESTASLYYGALFVGETSGKTNIDITVSNTGNIGIDTEASGTDMCTDYPGCAGINKITVDNQKYSLTSFDYAVGGTALSVTAVRLQTNLTKPTASPSNSSAKLYWGIGIPLGLDVGSYSGRIYLNAVKGD